MMERFSDEKFCFLAYVADPKANVLIKGAKEKRLEAKVMSLLVLLASHSGEVVMRQQILEKIWPDVVVGEEVIAQLIYALRNVLGDDAKFPKYIETIPKKGYRFIANVQAFTNEKSTHDRSILTVDKIPSKYSKNTLLIGGFLLITTAIIIWTTTALISQDKTNAFKVKEILPITQSKGVEKHFALNVQRNKMIYVSNNENKTNLYLKALDTNKLTQLTHDDWGKRSPVWLDSNTVLYIQYKSGKSKIIQLNLGKKSEVIYESNYRVIDLAINPKQPDKVTFIEYDNYRHNRLNELKVLNLIDLNVQYLHDQYLNLPSEVHHPIFSADGNTLFFTDKSNKNKLLVSLNLLNSEYTTISKAFSAVEHISTIGIDELLVSGTLSATKGIWRVNLNNQSIELVLPSSAGSVITRAEYHDALIYYSTYKTSINQVVANVEQQTYNLLPELNSNADELSGIYSKDNKTIYFVSNRTGYYELWAYNLDEKQSIQVSNIQATFIQKPILSHNEEYLAVVYEKEELTLAVISIKTGLPISKVTIPSMKYPLAWSKDDKSLYISEHKNQVNIYQYDFETLIPELLQKKAGLFAQESHDGTALYLVDYTYNGLIQKNFHNEKILELNNSINSLQQLMPGQIKVVGQNIIAVKYDSSSTQLFKYSLENNNHDKSSQKLMTLPKRARVSDFSIEGKRVIFTLKEPPQGDIMQVTLNSL